MQEPDIIKRWHESVVKAITENSEDLSGQLGFSFSEQEVKAIIVAMTDKMTRKIGHYKIQR